MKNSRIRELEATLVDFIDGNSMPPPGMDAQEAIESLREELEEALRQEAWEFLEETKDLSKNDQIASWRNWLVNVDGTVYPWRNNVYCELDTPTQPSPVGN